MLTIMAIVNSNTNKGITKDDAIINLNINVEIVDSHISLSVCIFSASSDICIPNASDNESAIAIVNIPPMTTIDEFVLECRPIINPSVVIIPDVTPKLSPTFIECFTFIDISFQFKNKLVL